MIPRPMDQETQKAWDGTTSGQVEAFVRARTQLLQPVRAAMDVFLVLARFLPGRKG